jgi:hypothetical protein
LRNTSIVLGEHPSSVTLNKTLHTAIQAGQYGNMILDFAKDVDGKLRNGTKAHLKRISPSPEPVQPHDNWTAYWMSERPVDPQWLAPPITQKITEWMGHALHQATYEIAAEVPSMVHDDIMHATREMVQRMREKPLPPTRHPPQETTTWAPPPAIAPPAAPRAAPAVASPPAAPGAPGAPGEGSEAGPSLGVGYIKGPDGQYYAIDLDKLAKSTTYGPTTPIFTTTPRMIMGANGRMYAAPKTPAMMMGANGRMYSVR